MKMLLLKKVFRQSIIITLIVSLAFTPVAALENGSDVPQETSAEQQQDLPEQQVPSEDSPASVEAATEEAIGEGIEDSLITEQEVYEQSEREVETEGAAEKNSSRAVQDVEELPEVSASGNDGNTSQEKVQEYEEMADSWRFRNGEILRETSEAPLLYASFKPWEWSSSKGGYLSSNGKVIKGAIRKGVDVSAWQPNIDWAKVKKAGIDFAILRCGYGDNIKSQDDSTWKYNVQQCEKYGIPYGVYIYSYVESDSEARSEAKHVLRLLKEVKAEPAYPVYYDLEDNTVRKHGRKKIIRWAKIFCKAIEAEGYRAGIYANLNWWNNYLNDSSLNKYEKWVAQYYNRCQYEGEYRIWQCASNGKVSGIKGNVDINFEFQLDDTDSFMGKWVKDTDGKTVFKKGNGTIAKSQWIVYNGKKYYVDKYGQKAKGFQTIKGEKYYFSNGVMQKGKWLTVSKKKYYASSTGKLVTGYKKIGAYYYGFNSSGAMLTGTKVLGGKRYKFASNGKAYLGSIKMKKAASYRTGPSTKYKKKGSYKKDKSAYIIRQKNGWGQLSNGYWVQMKYAKKTTTYPQFVAYKVKTKAALNYRTGPSTKYKRKGTYKKGKVLTIKGTKNGWGKLSNGYWVKLSYTKRV